MENLTLLLGMTWSSLVNENEEDGGFPRFESSQRRLK